MQSAAGSASRACPTGAIQPALLEGGLESLWTPGADPSPGLLRLLLQRLRSGLPGGGLPSRRSRWRRSGVAVLGRAYIDRNRCIPWADHRPCIVCEEMRPVPEKAIVLEEATVTDAAGQPVTVQQPRVVEERCIGCGICEYKCPVSGEAAIRVFPVEG